MASDILIPDVSLLQVSVGRTNLEFGVLYVILSVPSSMLRLKMIYTCFQAQKLELYALLRYSLFELSRFSGLHIVYIFQEWRGIEKLFLEGLWRCRQRDFSTDPQKHCGYWEMIQHCQWSWTYENFVHRILRCPLSRNSRRTRFIDTLDVMQPISRHRWKRVNDPMHLVRTLCSKNNLQLLRFPIVLFSVRRLSTHIFPSIRTSIFLQPQVAFIFVIRILSQPQAAAFVWIPKTVAVLELYAIVFC